MLEIGDRVHFVCSTWLGTVIRLETRHGRRCALVRWDNDGHESWKAEFMLVRAGEEMRKSS